MATDRNLVPPTDSNLCTEIRNLELYPPELRGHSRTGCLSIAPGAKDCQSSHRQTSDDASRVASGSIDENRTIEIKILGYGTGTPDNGTERVFRFTDIEAGRLLDQESQAL